MKRYVIALVCGLMIVAGGLSAPQAWGQKKTAAPKAEKSKKKAPTKADANEPKANDVSAFMQLKLNHAQKVLEGIALEDFDEIAKHSQDMGLLAQDENWRVYQTLEYRQHSADFQRIAAALTKAAQNKNLDGAALAYVELTMSCVNCHKYTRGVRMARR